jgi:hypothetical protein
MNAVVVQTGPNLMIVLLCFFRRAAAGTAFLAAAEVGLSLDSAQSEQMRASFKGGMNEI